MYMRMRKVKFPCTVCSCESGDGTIQCSDMFRGRWRIFATICPAWFLLPRLC